jgi:hypothetical protein
VKRINRRLYNTSTGGDDSNWGDWSETHLITNFPEEIDMWLLENCPMKWVTGRIKDQYGLLLEEEI